MLFFFFFFTRFLSLINRYSKIQREFGIIIHFPSLNIFHTIYRSYLSLGIYFFFIVPKLTESSNKIKEEKKERTEPRERTETELNAVKEQKKKKKTPETEPSEKKKTNTANGD